VRACSIMTLSCARASPLEIELTAVLAELMPSGIEAITLVAPAMPEQVPATPSRTPLAAHVAQFQAHAAPSTHAAPFQAAPFQIPFTSAWLSAPTKFAFPCPGMSDGGINAVSW